MKTGAVGVSQTPIRNVFASHRVKNLHNAGTNGGRPSASVKKSSFATDDNCHGWVSSCIPKRCGAREKSWM